MADWHYFLRHEPEFNMGLTLRQIELARSPSEESDLPKEWRLYVYNERRGHVSRLEIEAKGDKQNVWDSNGAELVELRSIGDARRHITQDSILVMRHCSLEETLVHREAAK